MPVGTFASAVHIAAGSTQPTVIESAAAALSTSR